MKWIDLNLKINNMFMDMKFNASSEDVSKLISIIPKFITKDDYQVIISCLVESEHGWHTTCAIKNRRTSVPGYEQKQHVRSILAMDIGPTTGAGQLARLSVQGNDEMLSWLKRACQLYLQLDWVILHTVKQVQHKQDTC